MTRTARPAHAAVRTAAAIATLGAVAGLTACGGPRALTQEEVGATLVTAGELGEAGWTAGTIGEAAPESPEGGIEALLRESTGVQQPCRDALVGFGTVNESAQAFATVGFTQPAPGPLGARELVVTLSSYAEDPPRTPDPADTIRACPSFDLAAGGATLNVRLRAAAYDVEGATGLGFDLGSGAERLAFDVVRVERGPNLITASLTGEDAETTAELLRRVVARQTDKVMGAG